MIPKLTDELMLATALKAKGIKTNAFDGLTTIDQRKAAFRRAIAQEGAEHVFDAQFRSVYGEPLDADTTQLSPESISEQG